MVPYSTGAVMADWTAPTLWPFNGNAFTAPISLASGFPGLADAAADAASGVWTVSYAGGLWHQPAVGAATALSLPAGQVYTGCAVAGGQPYVMTAPGAVLTSAGVQIGAWPWPSAGAFAGSGSMLVALLQTIGVGTMTTAGVTGAIALPNGITTAACLSVGAGTPVAIAGWQAASGLTGSASSVLSPVDPTTMLAVGSNKAMVWRAASGLTDAWNQTQQLGGLTVLTSLAWTPDGFHALAASPASGVVQVLNYAVGVISLAQTITVSGAAAVAVAGDSLHALVVQSGQSQLAPMVNTGTWATGTAVTGVPGITAVISYGPSGAVAAYASGLAYLTLATGGWSIANRLNLGYVPSVLTQDPFGTVYAAGSGVLSVISAASAVTGSGAWAGAAPTGIAVQQGRVLLAVPSDGLLYIFGQASPGAWASQNSIGLAAGVATGLGLSETTLFVSTASVTALYGFSGSPFQMTVPVIGAAAQLIGGAWVTTSLGIGATPTAIGFDSSGTLRVATVQNTLFNINSAGTVIASGLIPQYIGQPRAVPLGVSSILPSGTGVYLATSLSGNLIVMA